MVIVTISSCYRTATTSVLELRMPSAIYEFKYCVTLSTVKSIAALAGAALAMQGVKPL